ncbi:MAG: EAL domain-containing protein [Rhodospirillaceae bacterium]|nr:EAL domain-containing protein [Rhodospirillaceae bacterium]MBT3492655.1 EAL domain-containing protein [Rhodospirillaceae bacterium]MBT3779650.1 EAL domain-containing protein [Rhodospirillaceae bacterium]MBT3975943.1 EAL domain-containing protein [Rhodospirillaceae bacterium]MBT4170620.1 EAL domain-containing protein [Rhodospirillaceae bacterium]
MTEILFIGRDDDAEAAVLAALDGSTYSVHRVRTVAAASALLAEQRFDALIIDFDDAGAGAGTGPGGGPGFDLAQLLGLFLFVPTIALMDDFTPEMVVQLVQFGAQDSLVKSELGNERLTVSIQCAISRAHMAHYDSLTGLPNRALLFDRLTHAINQSRRYDHELAVLFIDLDRFKFVNDTMGHEAGDMVLKTVASRIRECLRESDTVARLGGDEFIALVTNLDAAVSAATVASKIVESVSRPIMIGGNGATISASIGIALFPDDAESADDLMRLSDAAMYQAKQIGGEGYQFYRPDMNSSALRRIGLGVALQRAIRHDEFELHYQPQIDLNNGEIVGLEALVRWNHPERGMIPPDQFIPLAEELGLMTPLGNLILGLACNQIAEWQRLEMPVLRVAVNLSAHQFNQDDLLEHVQDWIDKTGVDAALLEVELTESSIMQDPEAAAGILGRLSDAGVRVTIDDFGTGYSSLAYLKRFPLDALKIDRSFVRDVTHDASDGAIVRTVIALAQHLGLQVVAEGVETEEQLEFLRANSCQFAQGFYFSPPVPADEVFGVIARLERQNLRPAVDEMRLGA